MRPATSAPVTAYSTDASALFASSDTASPATNSRSRYRTSSNVQIGQIGRLSPYSASNFMNSASDRSSICGMFASLHPSAAVRNFAYPGERGPDAAATVGGEMSPALRHDKPRAVSHCRPRWIWLGVTEAWSHWPPPLFGVALTLEY